MAKSATEKTPLASGKNEFFVLRSFMSACEITLWTTEETALTRIELLIWAWIPIDEAIQQLSHTLCTKWRPLYHRRMSAHVVTYHEVRTPISAHWKHGTPATYTWHLPRGEEREPDLPRGISSLTLGCCLCGGEGTAHSWAWRGFLFPKTPLS